MTCYPDKSTVEQVSRYSGESRGDLMTDAEAQSMVTASSRFVDPRDVLPRRRVLSGASGALIGVLVLPSAAQASSPGDSVPSGASFFVDIDDDRDGSVVVSFYEG